MPPKDDAADALTYAFNMGIRPKKVFAPFSPATRIDIDFFVSVEKYKPAKETCAACIHFGKDKNNDKPCFMCKPGTPVYDTTTNKQLPPKERPWFTPVDSRKTHFQNGLKKLRNFLKTSRQA